MCSFSGSEEPFGDLFLSSVYKVEGDCLRTIVGVEIGKQRTIGWKGQPKGVFVSPVPRELRWYSSRILLGMGYRLRGVHGEILGCETSDPSYSPLIFATDTS